MSLREPPSPHSAATADLATPPGDCDETLLRAIEAGQTSATSDHDPHLAEALAAYHKIESLFALLRGPADVPPEPHADPQPERFGRYLVRGTLGAGAFGTVYLADDPELGRPVAIKAPRLDSLALRERAGVRANSLSLRERAGVRADQIVAEARHAAQLNHPAIVAIYDVGREGDRPYIVMQYVPGTTLEALLTSRATWDDLPRSSDSCDDLPRSSNPWDDLPRSSSADGLARPPHEKPLGSPAHGIRLTRAQSAELLATVADALHYAHKLGFVHRDLKPSNILIDAHGRPHVADFGLAVSEDTQRQHAGQLAGTPAFMSPEQVRGEAHHLDGRTDIWSLGVIGYQLLTGRQPFWRGDLVSCLDEIQHRDPKPPRQIDDAIPPELERIILKCLAKRPTDRYTAAADVARALRQWRRSRDGRARRAFERLSAESGPSVGTVSTSIDTSPSAQTISTVSSLVVSPVTAKRGGRKWQRLQTFLRWIAFVPAAVVVGITRHVILLLLNRWSLEFQFLNPDSVFGKLVCLSFSSVIPGGLTVVVAAAVAPRHEKSVAVVAAGSILFLSGLLTYDMILDAGWWGAYQLAWANIGAITVAYTTTCEGQ